MLHTKLNEHICIQMAKKAEETAQLESDEDIRPRNKNIRQSLIEESDEECKYIHSSKKS